MMNLEQAIAYGKHIGVRFYIYNEMGCLIGGSITRKGAEDIMRRKIEDDKTNPWLEGRVIRYEIREVKN